MTDANLTFAQAVENFRHTIETAAERLSLLPDNVAAQRPAAGKWSAKEIIGHLLDSAANNQARFVRAQSRPDLVFEGYDQEHWVSAQNYQNAAWPLLVHFWRAYNLHLAHVMENTPATERTRLRLPHSLDRIAWQTVDAATPTTLEYLMRDYIGHLENHLRQIFGSEERVG